MKRQTRLGSYTMRSRRFNPLCILFLFFTIVPVLAEQDKVPMSETEFVQLVRANQVITNRVIGSDTVVAAIQLVGNEAEPKVPIEIDHCTLVGALNIHACPIQISITDSIIDGDVNCDKVVFGTQINLTGST